MPYCNIMMESDWWTVKSGLDILGSSKIQGEMLQAQLKEMAIKTDRDTYICQSVM